MRAALFTLDLPFVKFFWSQRLWAQVATSVSAQDQLKRGADDMVWPELEVD